MTASELLHGLYRARTASQRHRRQAFVEALLAQIPVIAFDLMVARVHASLWAEMAKKGIAVGERDLMIGATAVAKGYAVATRDERSFPKIPGLKVDNATIQPRTADEIGMRTAFFSSRVVGAFV